ncbi:MAG: hypothetical protein WAW52_14400 [Methanothrix sp.]
MGLQKSDAMLQHEKWIAWVVEHNPKWIPGMDKQVHLMPEASKMVMVFAAIVVIIAAVISMYP